MKLKTKIGVAIGIAMIVIGAVLKEYSLPFLGDIFSFTGAVFTIYALFSDQQGEIIMNQRRMTETLDMLAKGQREFIEGQEGLIEGQERLREGQDRTAGTLEEIRNLLRR